MLKAIHTQQSREAADNKAQAIVDEAAGKQDGKLANWQTGKLADLVEQAVQGTLTYRDFGNQRQM
jgi:hypothetical protein